MADTDCVESESDPSRVLSTVMPNVVLVTGAAGWLANLVAQQLGNDPITTDLQLILTDVVEPKVPDSARAIAVQADLTDKSQIDHLLTATVFGVPDTIYCLHGIMSRGAEDNFDLGLKVNLDSVRGLLEAARDHATTAKPIKFIFASSLAVYGGPLPDVITPDTITTPQSSYGMEKLAAELLINEFSRRGFVDGRILRLPTIVVRPGAPALAASAFISGIIREPLKGRETLCPIGDSLQSPELDIPLWLASSQTTIKNLITARHIPASAFVPHTRVVCLPGFTATVRDELKTLEEVAGKEVLELVKFQDDVTNRRIVASWPAHINTSYALGLGFVADEGGMAPIVRRFRDDVLAGVV